MEVVWTMVCNEVNHVLFASFKPLCLCPNYPKHLFRSTPLALTAIYRS